MRLELKIRSRSLINLIEQLLLGAWLAAAFSDTLSAALPFPAQQAYLKASNAEAFDVFGIRVAVSGDTMVIGASAEACNATGVNGIQSDDSAAQSGAAYVFVRIGTNWVQQAYLKASNTGIDDQFGYSVAVCGDTIVVGAFSEKSNATGVNGNGANNSAPSAGAAYVFVRTGTNWSQQAYLKASNAEADDLFGISVAVSGDTVAVGAFGEASNASGVNHNQTNNAAPNSGAAYIFVRTGTNWSQQAYLKASNPEVNASFGGKVALSRDLVLVGAAGESSNAPYSGAAYIFARSGTNWSQQAYLKASNPGGNDQFGGAIALSADMAIVGAPSEDSNATGVNGDQSNDSGYNAGAAYVFVRSGSNWSQQAYLKPSNRGTWGRPWFGYSVAVSGDTALVGAPAEESNGDASGAAYVFVRSGTNWKQQAFLKASNVGTDDHFGYSVAISGDTALIGALSEASNATGVNGNQSDNSANQSGAAYVFTDVGLGIFPDGRGGYSTRFKGITGTTYGLERAIAVSGPWTNIATSTPIEFSNIVGFYDTNAPSVQAFYRTARPAN